MLTLLSIKFLYSENKSKNTFHHLSLYIFDPTLPLGIVIWTTLNPHYLMMPHIISAVFWSNGFWKEFLNCSLYLFQCKNLPSPLRQVYSRESWIKQTWIYTRRVLLHKFQFFWWNSLFKWRFKKKIFSLSIPIITDNFINKTAIVVHSTPRILIWTNLNVY